MDDASAAVDSANRSRLREDDEAELESSVAGDTVFELSISMSILRSASKVDLVLEAIVEKEINQNVRTGPGLQ